MQLLQFVEALTQLCLAKTDPALLAGQAVALFEGCLEAGRFPR